MKKDIPKEEVQRTMDSLDRLKRVKSSPDLYEKIMARVHEPVKVIPLYRRWQVAAAILMLIVNAFSISLYIRQNNDTRQTNYYEALAEDYSLGLSSGTAVQQYSGLSVE